jgi:WhiB family transcriptional regulator, redox-sensing transcriptional regulator
VQQVNLDAHTENPIWHQRAACKGLDPDLFHPERGGDTSGAKRVCSACPVKAECLAFALTTFEKHGIWGGLSERERRKIRGQLTKAGLLTAPMYVIDHGTSAGYHAHRRRGEVPCRSCMEARNAAEGRFANTA